MRPHRSRAIGARVQVLWQGYARVMKCSRGDFPHPHSLDNAAMGPRTHRGGCGIQHDRRCVRSGTLIFACFHAFDHLRQAPAKIQRHLSLSSYEYLALSHFSLFSRALFVVKGKDAWHRWSTVKKRSIL